MSDDDDSRLGGDEEAMMQMESATARRAIATARLEEAEEILAEFARCSMPELYRWINARIAALKADAAGEE